MPIPFEAYLAPQKAFSLGQIAVQNQQQQAQEQEYRQQRLDMQQQDFDYRRQQDARTQEEAQMKQRQAQALKVSQIARWVESQPDKQTAYQQAIRMAQSTGMDVAGAPPQYDPSWVREQAVIGQIFAERPEVLSTVGKEAVDAGYVQGTPEFQNYVKQRLLASDTKTIPVQPGGSVYEYAPGQGARQLVQPYQQQGGGGGGSVPQAAADYLRSNPNLKAEFDAKYGQGAADRVLGGAGGNASGGFRPVGMQGERVTSTRRSAAHNRRVGGVANSYHLTGQARDSVPPPGMSMNEYHRRLKALNPHLDVINEGDHIHMEPR